MGNTQQLHSPDMCGVRYSGEVYRSQLMLDTSGKGDSKDSASSMEWCQAQFEGLPGPLLGSLRSSRLFSGCCSLVEWGQISTKSGDLAHPGCAAAYCPMWESRKAWRAAPVSCWYQSTLLKPESHSSLWGGSQLRLSVILLASSCPLQSLQKGGQATSALGAVILSSISTGTLWWEHSS